MDTDQRASHADAVAAVRAEAAHQLSALTEEPECGRAAAIFRALTRSAYLSDLAARGGGYYMSTWGFFAAVQFVVAKVRPTAFNAYFRDGSEQSALASPTFDSQLEAFCRAHESDIEQLVRTRSCQMNEVNRCASALVPALAHVLAAADRKRLSLIEVGTSAGLQLMFDRYRYEYGDGTIWGDAGSEVTLECRLMSGRLPDLDCLTEAVASRTGVDIAPPTLSSPDTRQWIEASSGFAMQRTSRLIDLVTEMSPAIVEGDAADLIGDLVAAVPADQLPVVYNSASVIYFPRHRQETFGENLKRASLERDLVWISNETFRIDPTGAVITTQGAQLPEDVTQEIIDGAFRVAVEVTWFKAGVARTQLVAVAHPWGLWTRWLA